MSRLKVTYGGSIIEPAPSINIEKEFIYANDTIIGYKYVLNISGYGSSVNTRLNRNDSNITNTIVSLEAIKDALMRNGALLVVSCIDTNETIFSAYGGLLRSFDISESPNRMSQYAQYTATIDFNKIDFTNTSNLEVSADSVASSDPTLVEYLRHLQSYNDNWNFTIAESDMYRYYNRVTAEGLLNLEDYTTINVSYTINATGKHTFGTDGSTVMPWQRAKEFVQYKLWNQIYIFRNTGPLTVSNFNSTYYNSNAVLDPLNNSLNQSHTSTLTSIPAIYPILHQSITSNYTIFNEVITCNTTEGAGSFTATYSCVLKFTNPNANWPQKSIHTFTVSYDQTRDFQNADRTITVNGSLEGMIATNILGQTTGSGGVSTNLTGQTFNLPTNGKFIDTLYVSPVSKYTNALDDFVRYIANAPGYNYNYFGSDDLSPAFKAVLSINYATLFPNTLPTDISDCQEGQVNLSSLLALPQSFNVDHDYNGTVSYSATYSTTRSCATERGFETLSITEVDPVPTYVEFTVPGRAKGPILQNLNTHNQKRITFDFDGTTKKGCLNGTPFSDIQLNDFSGVCTIDDYVNFPPAVMCMLYDTENNHPELIPESYSYDYNPIDGSFKLSKTYIVCGPNTSCTP